MDSTDVRIFCEMAFRDSSYNAFADRHVSPAEIGRKLMIDEKTVRVRIKRMEDSGFIKYYQAIPNLALFGLRGMGSFRFEALNLSTKFVVVRNLHQVPGLVETTDYLGPFLSAVIAGASTTDVQETAKGLAKRYELNLMNLGSSAVREPLARTDRLDWQVIQKLRYDARSTTNEIADALSATPRMVGYRIAKLLGSGAVSIRAVIDAQKQGGLIFYELEVAVNKESHTAVVGWLREKFGERLWLMKNPAPGIILVSLFGFTLGEPEDTAMEALRVEGVKRCSLFILKEIIEPRRSSWLDAFIERRISG